MRVTIIPVDSSVIIDGEFIIIDEMPTINPSIHAVQWNGNSGTIEHKDTNITNNVVITHVEEITELTHFQEVIDIAITTIAADKQKQAEREIVTSEMIVDRIRTERDFKLIQSDWTQLSDVTLSPSQITLWKEYRQKLRDITLQSNFPNDIVWPEKPE